MSQKIIKDTKYCQILSRGKLADEDYYKWYDKNVRKRSYKNVQFSFYKL